MILTPAQSIVAKDSTRFRVLLCGRRWGKTTLAAEEIKGKALAKPVKIVYIAPTIQQARDIAWATLKNELRPITIKSKEAPSLELVVRTIGGGESTIFLRGWEAIETLRGQSFDFIVIDEVASMKNFWHSWQEVIRPTLTDRKGEAMFISTPKGFNSFYELYNKEAEDVDFRSFHFTTYDNPHIPTEEIDKAKEELTEDRFAQEYLADFRRTEGIVYKEFNRALHLYDKLPEGLTVVDRLIGVDFGYTNPTAIVLLLKDSRGNFWLDSEWYKTGQTNDQIAETAFSFNASKAYPDPEAPEKIAELRKSGINCMEVTKGKDSIKNGINKVRELFKQGRLKVNRACTNIIWEFETYSYPEARPDNPNPEIPIKENDHLLDSLRYVLMTNNAVQVATFKGLGQKATFR